MENITTAYIIQKLQRLNDSSAHSEEPIKEWSIYEKKKLLEIYSLFSRNEHKIFDLIYRYHGCYSWEDTFREYSDIDFDFKTRGIGIAIDGINEEIEYEKIERVFKKV